MNVDIKFTLTLIVSFGALVFSFLNYRRSKKIENENHIYKLKVDVYSKILAELNSLLNNLEDNLEDAKDHLKFYSEETFEKLNKQADNLDKLCFDFNDFLVHNSLVIPRSILNALDKFVDKILDSESLNTDTLNIESTINYIEDFIDELINDADAISELLRKDLRIDELNISLYKRLK